MKKYVNLITIIAIFAVVTVISVLSGGGAILLDFGEDHLTISGVEDFSCTVNYRDIDTVELLASADLGTAAGGAKSGPHSYGVWRSDAWGDYTLCVTNKSDHYIIITETNGHVTVFNYQNSSDTELLFEAFRNHLEEYGA